MGVTVTSLLASKVYVDDAAAGAAGPAAKAPPLFRAKIGSDIELLDGYAKAKNQKVCRSP
tara:strand:+ start:1126 stop:1305 length:180 start_codon:yes stop_codon:yes gene_type:complete